MTTETPFEERPKEQPPSKRLGSLIWVFGFWVAARAESKTASKPSSSKPNAQVTGSSH